MAAGQDDHLVVHAGAREVVDQRSREPQRKREIVSRVNQEIRLSFTRSMNGLGLIGSHNSRSRSRSTEPSETEAQPGQSYEELKGNAEQ
jgi:hypothetical protein